MAHSKNVSQDQWIAREALRLFSEYHDTMRSWSQRERMYMIQSIEVALIRSQERFPSGETIDVKTSMGLSSLQAALDGVTIRPLVYISENEIWVSYKVYERFRKMKATDG